MSPQSNLTQQELDQVNARAGAIMRAATAQVGGRPSMMERMRPLLYDPALRERVVQRIRNSSTVAPNGCWNWRLQKDRDGYGRIKLLKVPVRAHRASVMAHTLVVLGAGIEVRHLCHNASCVNPDHLAVGTHQDNENDKCAANRQARGHDIHRSKLTEDDALAVRKAWRDEQPTTKQAIANRFGVARQTIHKILAGMTWRHLCSKPAALERA